MLLIERQLQPTASLLVTSITSTSHEGEDVFFCELCCIPSKEWEEDVETLDREHALYSSLTQTFGQELQLKNSPSLDVFDSTDLISILSFDVPPSLTSGSTVSDKFGIAKIASRLVKSRANLIVHIIAESMQPEETPTTLQIAISESDRETDLERYLQQQLQQTQQHCEPNASSIDPRSPDPDFEGYFDEDDEFDEPGKPNLANLDEVKKFMIESEAYEHLKNSFSHFASPLEEIIDTETQPIGMIKSVIPTPYRLHWSCVGHLRGQGMNLITNLS